MSDAGFQSHPTPPETLAGAAIPFRFDVTWRSLTRPLRPSGLERPGSFPESTRHETALNPLVPASRPPAGRPEAREWEMVLPRMERPQLGMERPQLARGAASVDAPRFAVGGESSQPRRLTIPVVAATFLVLSLAGYRWLRPADSEAAEVKASSAMEMRGAGWVSEWASDVAGSARGRQLTLYRPSIALSDYSLEFSGYIERRSLGWVFRAADSSNYYAAKLEAVDPGTSHLAITRFAVIHGVEGPHIQRSLTLTPSPTETLNVRLEARGPRFTILIQDRVVEDWEDDQLKVGGLGFLNEREELGQIKSLRISFPKGGAR